MTMAKRLLALLLSVCMIGTTTSMALAEDGSATGGSDIAVVQVGPGDGRAATAEQAAAIQTLTDIINSETFSYAQADLLTETGKKPYGKIKAYLKAKQEFKDIAKNNKISIDLKANSFTDAVTGTADNPNGTDGTYEFYIKFQTTAKPPVVLSTTTKVYTATIVATKYQGAITHTVTFNSKGGSTVDPIAVETGTTFTKPADPILAGYTFGGWYKEDACTTPWDFTNDKVSAPTKLYAKWEAEATYTATFVGGEGATGTAPAEMTGKKAKEIITLPANTFAKTGYTFSGWNDGTATYQVGEYTMPAKSVTFTAQWLQAGATTYTVTFNSKGGSIVDPIAVETGKTVAKPTDPTKASNTFGGWYKEDACTNLWNFATDTVTADTILYAKWTVVVAPPAELTSIKIVDGNGNAIKGNVKIPLNGNYTFKAIGYDASGKEMSFPTLSNLTWEIDKSNSVETPPTGITANAGVDNSCTVNVIDKTDAGTPVIKAKYDVIISNKQGINITCKLTFNSNGGTDVLPQEINRGVLATLPTPPTQAGFKFLGWYSDADFKTEFAFATKKVYEDTTLYAKWEKEIVPDAGELKASFAGGDAAATGSVTDIVAKKDSEITLPANSFKRKDFTFTGWLCSADNKTYNVGDKYKLTANVTFTAQWKAAPPPPPTPTQGIDAIKIVNAENKPIGSAFIPIGGNQTFKAVGYDGGTETVFTDLSKLTWTIEPKDPAKPLVGINIAATGDSCTVSSEKEIGGSYPTLYVKYGSISQKLDVRFTCKITFVTNGGTAVSEIPAQKWNDPIKQENSNTTREGYNFDGWYTDEACTTPLAGMRPTADTTLYAKWVSLGADEAKASFAGGDAAATGSVTDIVDKKDSEITLPANSFKRKDFTFTGWLCSADNKTYNVGDKYKLTANVTFTAQWKAGEAPKPTQAEMLTAAKAAIAAETFSYKQTDLADYVKAYSNVGDQVRALQAVIDLKAEYKVNVYVRAQPGSIETIPGTKENPAGTNGTYNFKIEFNTPAVLPSTVPVIIDQTDLYIANITAAPFDPTLPEDTVTPAELAAAKAEIEAAEFVYPKTMIAKKADAYALVRDKILAMDSVKKNGITIVISGKGYGAGLHGHDRDADGSEGYYNFEVTLRKKAFSLVTSMIRTRITVIPYTGEMYVAPDPNEPTTSNNINTPATLERLSDTVDAMKELNGKSLETAMLQNQLPEGVVLATAPSGKKMAVVPAKMTMGASFSMGMMETLGGMGDNVGMQIQLDDTAEILMPGGFGNITEEGRLSYPMRFLARAESRKLMVKKAHGKSVLNQMFMLGGDYTLPVEVTVAMKTTLPEGSEVTVNHYDKHTGLVSLVGETQLVTGGRVRFTTAQMGEFIISTGNVNNK